MLNARQGNRYAIVLVLITVFCAGCGTAIPVGKYDTLQSSTASLAATTSETFLRIEKLQRRFTVVTAPDSPLTMTTFRPTVGGVSFDIVPELRFRESALNVIVRYTTVLSALSSRDFATDVDKASQDFAAGVKEFTETLSKRSGDETGIGPGVLATLINILGRIAINRQREDGLRTAMDTAQKSLDQLCTLLAGSNIRIGQAVDLMAARIMAHANAARPAYATAGRYEFDAGMADFVEEISSIHASLDMMSRAARNIPAAHREIREELASKPTKFDALQSLILEVQRASTFYRSVENTK